MRYWDTSALVCLVIRQPASRAARRLQRQDPEIGTWCLSEVEIRSALCRLTREGQLTAEGLASAWQQTQQLFRTVAVVDALDPVKLRASRLLALHSLRAADALQLGAALTIAADDPTGWELVCFDARLAGAAQREGFRVLSHS